MPFNTNLEAKPAGASRRTRIALIVAAIVILLPGLVMAILYSRHKAPAISEITRHAPGQPDGLAIAIEEHLTATGNLHQAVQDYERLVESGSQDYRVYDDVAS